MNIERHFTVCVVGLGKIGLPLAVQYAQSGMTVHGCDIDEGLVNRISAGEILLPNEAGLDEGLQEALRSGRLDVSTDVSTSVASSDIVVVVVPLLVSPDGRPDFRSLDSATRSIAAGLAGKTLVCYETTLPVGTTRNRFAPVLRADRLDGTILVAFSPERVYSGRIFADLRKYPKLVGGIDRSSTNAALDFYASALQFDERTDLARPNGVWDLGTSEAAELAKLAETTYRDVNIGFANELARYADSLGVDIDAVIDACNSQPFSQILRPGISVGGHCIPVYPELYLSTNPSAEIPRAARRANLAMPEHVVNRLSGEIGDLRGLEIVVLGIAYRGGVRETAFSGAFPLVAMLQTKGAIVRVHDPLYSSDELRLYGFEPWVPGSPATVVVLHTDHTEYGEYGRDDLGGASLVFDGRGVLNREILTRSGVTVLGIGIPNARPTAPDLPTGSSLLCETTTTP